MNMTEPVRVRLSSRNLGAFFFKSIVCSFSQVIFAFTLQRYDKRARHKVALMAHCEREYLRISFAKIRKKE